MCPREPRTPAIDPEEVLTRQADAVVVLMEAGPAAGEDSFWKSFCARMARVLPVYVVRPALPDDGFEIHRVGDRLTEVMIPLHPTKSVASLLSRQLCKEHHLRPLVLTSSPSAYRPFVGRYSSLTVFVDVSRREASPWLDGGGDPGRQAEWARFLGHVDLAVCGNEQARSFLDGASWFHGELVLQPELAGDGHGGDISRLTQVLCETLAGALVGGTRAQAAQRRLNVLVLYDDNETHIATLRDYLESFTLYSRNCVTYAPATQKTIPPPDLSMFDVVVFHYSVRMTYPAYFSLAYASAVRDFDGYKILYMQDEYEETEQSRQWMEAVGIHCLFTCVPTEYIHDVYSRERFPHVDFSRVLTGYVPERLENRKPFRPMAEREFALGYRGRALPYWYGNLGQDKLNIGVRMREICNARGVPCNIEWGSDHRLYGDAWFDFHLKCKAMLATESGANVFDDHGELRKQITAALEENPALTYEEAFERFLRPHEGKVLMGQVSPRLFEAMALGTALVLFEGRYDDILIPGVHYIELKKDYSNADAVLAKLADDDFLTAMVERCHRDIVASGAYSYRHFIADFDAYLSSRLGRGKGYQTVSAVVGYRDEDGVVHARDIGYRRGFASDQILYLHRDEYLKEPVEDTFRHLARTFDPKSFPEPAPVACVPATGDEGAGQATGEETPSSPRPVRRLPGVAWVDERLCKPFHRFWEYHRRRLQGRDRR